MTRGNLHEGACRKKEPYDCVKLKKSPKNFFKTILIMQPLMARLVQVVKCCDRTPWKFTVFVIYEKYFLNWKNKCKNILTVWKVQCAQSHVFMFFKENVFAFYRAKKMSKPTWKPLIYFEELDTCVLNLISFFISISSWTLLFFGCVPWGLYDLCMTSVSATETLC